MSRSTTRQFSTSSRVAVCAALVAALLLVLGHSALAADTTESIWSGTTSSDWSASGNWGAAGVPSTTVSAEFNSVFTNQPNLSASSTAQGIWDTGSTTTGVSGLTDIGSTTNQTLAITGTATLDGFANAGILLDGSGNNNLTLDSTIGGVTVSNSTSFLVNNTGTLTIGSGLTITTGKVLTIGGTNRAGTVRISGSIANTTGSITMNGADTLILSGSSNQFTGGVTLSAVSLNGTAVAGTLPGTLDINSATALGVTTSGTTGVFTIGVNNVQVDNTSGNNSLDVTNNNPIALNANFIFKGSNSLDLGAGTVTLGGTRSIKVAQNTLTMDGTFSGTQTLDVSGAGSLVLTAASNPEGFVVGMYNGSYSNGTGGNVTLNGNAFLLNNTQTINLIQGGTLTLDNSVTAVNNRLAGGGNSAIAGTHPVTFSGGNLTIKGSPTQAIIENLGAINNSAGGGAFGANSGQGIISLLSSPVANANVASGQPIELTLASLPTQNVGGNYTAVSLGVIFRGTNLGVQVPGGTGAFTNIMVTSAPILTGNGGGAGNPGISILANAIGDSVSPDGTTHTYGLVTYDPTLGIRLLNTSTEYSPTIVANDNVLLNGGTTNVGTTVSINAILLENNATLTSSNGAQLNANAQTAIYGAIGGNTGGTMETISAALRGSQPMQFDVLGDTTVLSLTSNLNSGTVSLFGTGTLLYAGTNIGSDVRIEGGTFKVNTSAAWWNTGGQNFMIGSNGTLDLNGHNSSIFTSNNGFEGGGTITTTGGAAVLTLTANQQGLFYGNFNDGAGSTGVLTVRYSNANNGIVLGGGGTFSGGLYVAAGAIELGSDTAQGLSNVFIGDNTGSGTASNAALLFGASETAQGLLKPSTISLAVEAGGAGTATFGIGANAADSTIFNGSVALGKNAFITGNMNFQSLANSATVAGTFTIGPAATFSGVGSLTQSGGQIDWTSTTGYSIPGGFTIALGISRLNLTGDTAGTYGFLNPAAATLNGTTMATSSVQNIATFSTIVTGTGTYNITAPFTIGANGATLLANNSFVAGTTAFINYSGAISLGGMLAINGNGLQNGTGSQSAITAFDHYSGTITLANTGSLLGIRYQGANDNNGDPVQSSSLDSVIQDGVGTTSLPVALQASIFTGNSYEQFNVTGASIYAGGTLIRSAPNIINVTASGATFGNPAFTTSGNATLGTGNLYIEAGGNIRLNSSASVNTANGATLTVAGDALNTSVLSLGYVPASQTGLNITSTSSGTLGIDTGATNFTLALTMGNLGNGSMFLGSFSTGTYSASTLGVGASAPTPGTGTMTPTYRLGTGGGLNSNNVLTISGTDVITGNTNVIVDLPGARDASDNILGAPIGNYGGGGTVKFTANQDFTGTVLVNGGAGGATGTPAGILELAVTASGQPLGSGSTNVFLNGGVLQYDMPGTARTTNLSIGNLTVLGGASMLYASNNNVGSVLTINSIVRQENGVLFVAANNLTNVAGGLGASGTSFKVTSNIGNIVPTGSEMVPVASASTGMVTIGGSVAPWIMYSANNGGGGGEFLAYDTGNNRFIATTYTVGASTVHAVDDTTGFAMSNTLSNDIVQLAGTLGTDATMSTSQTIYALNSQKNGATIKSNNATGTTLTITSGALTADEQNSSLTFGVQNATGGSGSLNLNFGTAGAAEAVIYISGSGGGLGTLNLWNTVTAAGVTKVGEGNLNLGNTSITAPNVISGPITILQGFVVVPNEASLGTVGSSGNHIVLNGGGLSLANTAAALSHPVDVGSAGGSLIFKTTTSVTSNISDSSTIPSGIAAGPLSIAVQGNTVTFNTATSQTNQWSGGTVITSTGTGSVVVANNVNFGTGDVNLFIATNRGNGIGGTGYNTILTLQGPNNLGANAGVNTDFGSTLNLTNTSGTVVIGSLEGSGNVVLGVSAGAGTTASFGSNGRSTLFDGVISQVSTSASGIIKAGSGSFTLAGANTYAGPTVVSGGTLRITGSLAGTGTVTVGGNGSTGTSLNLPTLSGTGRVAGAVTINGPGTGIAGVIAASNVTGITPLTTVAPLTLTGGLTLNAGSFSSFTLNSSSPNNTSNPLIAVSGGSGLNIAGASQVNLAFSSNAALAVGQTYDLFGYSSITNFSGLSVNLAFPGLPSSFGYLLVNNVAGSQVDLQVTANLVWSGVPGGGGSLNNAGTPGQWDTTSFNWVSSTNAAAQFSNGSGVQFGDSYSVTGGTTGGTPSSSVVVQAGGIQSGNVTFSSHTVSYTFSDADGSGGAGISDSTNGPTNVTLSGNGGGGSVVTFTNPNSYTGTTTIAGASTLVISNNNQLGSASGTIAPLTFNNGTLKYAASSTNTDISGRMVTFAAGGATIDVNGNPVSYANAIGNSGSGGLTVASTTAGGTLTLTGANNYTGTTTVNSNATLQLGNGTVTGTLASTSVSISSSATVVLDPASNHSFGNTFSGNGQLVTQGSTASVVTQLTGTNSYSGGTAIQSGTLQVTSNSNLVNGSLPLNTALTVGGSLAGQLDLNSHNVQVSALNSTNSSSDIETTTGTVATLTFAGTGSPSVYAGTIQGISSPTIALTVTGGTLSLTSASTYIGGTIVNGGTLNANGPGNGTFLPISATGGGPVTVGGSSASGTPTLGGGGEIYGLLTINGAGGGAAGHLSPGGSAGRTLTIDGGLTLNSGANLDYTLGTSPTLTSLASGTTLTLNPNLTLNVTQGSGFATGTQYTLINNFTFLSDSSSSFSGWTATGVGSDTPTFSIVGTSLDVTFAGGSSGPTAYSGTPSSSTTFPTNFGTSTPFSVVQNGSYAGLQSSVTGGTVGPTGGDTAGAPLLTQVGGVTPLTATILAGTNTTGGTRSVSMTWRTRTTWETGPTSASPPLPFVGQGGLISNVLNLSGMSASGSEPVQTDPFVLDLQYNPQAIPGLGSLTGGNSPGGALANAAQPYARNGAIYLAWLNPSAAGGPTWKNAVSGDFGAAGADAIQNFQGSFNAFLQVEFGQGHVSTNVAANLTGADLANILGSYGVDNPNYAGPNDVGGYDAWAVVNHNSQFAVVPEPNSLLLAALGLLGVAGYQVRRRRK